MCYASGTTSVDSEKWGWAVHIGGGEPDPVYQLLSSPSSLPFLDTFDFGPIYSGTLYGTHTIRFIGGVAPYQAVDGSLWDSGVLSYTFPQAP